MADISIVIVTWNTKKIAGECLDSLRQSLGPLSMEVIVVDNASSDGTADAIAEHYSEVKLIRNDSNMGFARANNIGIRASSGKYVCLINSDVVVPDHCLETMFRYMEQQPSIGVLGPKMRLADGSIGDSCMRFPTVGNWFCRALALDSLFKHFGLFGGFLMTDFRYDRLADVDILTGWFWMVRREALNQAGLLDERFFMYGEDIEWCRRFHDFGWRVVFYPDAEAIHYCGASSANAPTRFYVEMERADLQYFERYHGRLAVAAFWAASLLHQLLRAVGYSFLYMIGISNRPQAALKVRRQCLRMSNCTQASDSATSKFAGRTLVVGSVRWAED
jgi:GT2 family glycosyltransferase